MNEDLYLLIERAAEALKPLIREAEARGQGPLRLQASDVYKRLLALSAEVGKTWHDEFQLEK